MERDSCGFGQQHKDGVECFSSFLSLTLTQCVLDYTTTCFNM